jgi:prephenate dehydratase
MKRFLCPECSEVVVSRAETTTCKACGVQMVEITDSLMATMADRPGALADLLQRLAQKGINIRSLHAMPKEGGMALAFFSVDRAEEALTIPEVQRTEDLPITFDEDAPERQ